MAPTKETGKKQPAQSERTIQYVGGALIVLVLGFFVWQYAFKPGVTPYDCSVFDSIPQANQYASVPPTLIDTSKAYFAKFELEKGGTFIIQLYPEKAPITVNSFIFLTCKDFFNGVTFHRVLEDFMAQGGDPTGTGTGGPGYEFQNEDSDLTFNREGVVAMANAGRDTNGSQFFITFGPAEHLNGGYTIFGQVVEGMDVVNGITRRDPGQNPAFAGDVIKTVSINEE